MRQVTEISKFLLTTSFWQKKHIYC